MRQIFLGALPLKLDISKRIFPQFFHNFSISQTYFTTGYPQVDYKFFGFFQLFFRPSQFCAPHLAFSPSHARNFALRTSLFRPRTLAVLRSAPRFFALARSQFFFDEVIHKLSTYRHFELCKFLDFPALVLFLLLNFFYKIQKKNGT